MEQDVDNACRNYCTTCLSTDRNLYHINDNPQLYEVFKLLLCNFPGGRFQEAMPEMPQNICWECLAIMRRFMKFRQQVHSAQEHLRVVSMSRGHEVINMSHTYVLLSLSSLEMTSKINYDKIFIDYALNDQWVQQEYMLTPASNVKNEQFEVFHTTGENIQLDSSDNQGRIIEVPEIVLQNAISGNVQHILIREGDIDDDLGDNDTPEYITPLTPPSQVKMTTSIVKGENDQQPIYKTSGIAISTPVKDPLIKAKSEEEKTKICGFTTEYMTETQMLISREEAKSKIQYASAVYKCELCIIGFYNQQQVEDHFTAMHRNKPGLVACKVCYIYVEEKKLQGHLDQHYFQYQCKMCGIIDYSVKAMTNHVKAHLTNTVSNSVIKIGDLGISKKKSKRKKERTVISEPPKPGDLRKLLKRKTIEGYQCLECDMFFKNSRARKNHVQRFHREGLQCDHCKKCFVNRTTLATHLRLHEGPLPRKECPVCHKLVRVIQLKYHVQRHQQTQRYECTECNKTFSHLATYQAHLKYSRAHASDDIFKYPCPMCNKGYPTKETMQDHFNWQHLGKTSHKCPVCDKPIASRINVEKHMMRVHGEKKEKPRNHVCQLCGKGFTDRKALAQHEVIHSGDRPLVCDVCQQTFKQKASLYTHKKRVHKIFPSKKVVEFMDTKP